ncbi:MAG TPA: YbaK/EbsC family protein [Acidobacteriaceae bacterium]|nr:YbaK/EbsC family protein [Acidobacteriaceae bacterium]
MFIPTLRQEPAGVESAADRLLMRAGYIRPLPTAGFGQLMLAQRCGLKIDAIVRAEMFGIGAQEMRASVANLWAFGRELRSYKQLPQTWYQIQSKISSSFSFDLTADDLEASYESHRGAYSRILRRCGMQVSADHFMVESGQGDDFLVACSKCGDAANLRRAVARAQAPRTPDPDSTLRCEPFPTPGIKTIGEIAAFTGLPETSQIKSLVMNADGELVLALLRGDHQLSLAKLGRALGGAIALRPASATEILEQFGASAGSLGPLGVKGVRVFADEALQGRRNLIAGANRDDYHLRNVTPGEDFAAEFHDFREVVAGDVCPKCGAPVELRKATQFAYLSKLGPRYAEKSGLRVLDPESKEVVPFLGSYTLWTESILAGVVEQNHDPDGLILPAAIAPFTVVITPIHLADEQRRAAESIYQACLERGLDALLDDRDERPGVKFKDADLIGNPWRVVVGKRISEGLVEVVERRSRQRVEVGVADTAAYVAGQAAGEGGPSRNAM